MKFRENNSEEGYIKFNIEHSFREIAIPDHLFDDMSIWRSRLFDLKLIGETPEGIGYGNISFRFENGFIISGSATGAIRHLKKTGYAFVSDYDFNMNKVISLGLTKASSESLSHAAVYESNHEISAVIHVHSSFIWNKFLDKLPTTTKSITFGTPEMAYNIKKILDNTDFYEKGIIIMGGHEDGVITFGNSFDEAGKRLLKYM